MGLGIEIGFLPVSLWDILDILIVGYLLFQLYKLLRGSIAFNIFVGLALIYMSWFLVNQLGMDLLSSILEQFVSVGVIILIIIFQPEVRRFLLLLGNTTLGQRSGFLNRFLDRSFGGGSSSEEQVDILVTTLLRLARHRVGALIVFSRGVNLEGLVNGGVNLDAQVSQALLESIFNKESPLHDGAVLIDQRKITLASVILPVSESTQLHKSVGLRHRAAVGISERADVAALVVSEETGNISFAYQGKLERKLDEERLRTLLEQYSV
jgi:uncharacterized protein (TIGR00159 family)